jgi:hypothetical protein
MPVVLAATKTPTTPEVTLGIQNATTEVLDLLSEEDRSEIQAMSIGTTHFVNANEKVWSLEQIPQLVREPRKRRCIARKRPAQADHCDTLETVLRPLHEGIDFCGVPLRAAGSARGTTLFR